MGFKRPFDAEEFGEYPFKYSKQLQCNNKLSQFAEVPLPNQLPPKQARVDNCSPCKPQGNKSIGSDSFYEDLYFSGKGFEARAPVPCVTRSSSEELSDSGGKYPSSVSREYTELEVPRRSFGPVEDAYPLHLDRSPRKQVSIGPNHQANVPSWSGQVKEEELGQSDQEKLMGTCIIPMPDSDSFGVNDDIVGKTRMDCICIDGGSIRCVRQHVLTSREKLLKTMGYDKFVSLGLCEMGEEIVHGWNEEEEDLFHQIVYSNPVSLGRNFWKHLGSAFPFRSQKEIVSYYFNVFMLRKRAAQNRSNLLDIDSDDDEWHGSLAAGSFQVCVPDDDEDEERESSPPPPLNHDRRFDHRRRHNTLLDNKEEEEEVEEEEEDDSDDDDDDSDSGGVGVGMKISCDDATEEVGGDQDDSCISFELQSHKADDKTRVSVDGRNTKIDLNKFDGGCDDMVGEGDMYMLESYDASAKVWDFKYPTDTVDLQPTFNIIEEIFGQGTWDEHDKK